MNTLDQLGASRDLMTPLARVERKMTREQRERWTGLFLVSPVVIFFGVFGLFPMLFALVVSFFEWDLFSSPEYVGIDNYVSALGSDGLWSSFRVTGTYTLIVGPASWAIGFSLALLLAKPVRVGRALRSLFFAPAVFSAVAMAVVWTQILQPNGPLNSLLGLKVNWLTSSSSAMYGIAIMDIWRSSGWFMVVFLAGLLSIPPSLLEAARLDGASRLQELRYIVLPQLRPVIAFVVIHTVINGMKVFTPMFVMTGGGPNGSTTSVSMLIYQTGIRDLRMGLAAAVSMVALVIVLVLTAGYLSAFPLKDE